MKISRNPVIAYQQGYNEGYNQSCLDGFVASNKLLLLAMYNVIDDYISVTDDDGEIDDESTLKLQGEFAQSVEDEMQRLFSDEFNEEVDNLIVQNTDNIKIALNSVKKIRKIWGMKEV